MSRSFKKPILKDKKPTKYYKQIRSRTNDVVRQLKLNPDLELPQAKTIINDYDVCDYIFMIEKDNKTYNKATRK